MTAPQHKKLLPDDALPAMRAALWFFAALSFTALLSPPGATHDEWYHIGSILCGHGVREPYCLEIGEVAGYVSAVVKVDAVNCKVDFPTELLLCPAERSGLSRPLVNDGLYPPVFYFVLSWFVIPVVDVNVAIVRIVSTFCISLLLGLSLWLLPARFKVVLVLVVLTTFSVSGFFLFSSVNPSSWSAFGLGVGWLSTYASIFATALTRHRRLGLTIIGAAGLTMSAGSRWDSIPMVGFVLVLSGTYLGWVRYPRWRKQILISAFAISMALLQALERLSPFPPSRFLRLIYTYSDGQTDNLQFFSYNLLNALPNALRVFGQVPMMTLVTIPKLAYVTSLLLLGFSIFRTRNHLQVWQIIGCLLTVCFMSLMIVSQVAMNDVRDIGSIEPRYVFPLLIFGIGWWYLMSSDDDLFELCSKLANIVKIVAVVFAITAFSVTERYVERQTFGIRIIPEGPDNWWWPHIPIGPNLAVILAVIFLWKSLQSLSRLAFESRSRLQEVDHRT